MMQQAVSLLTTDNTDSLSSPYSYEAITTTQTIAALTRLLTTTRTQQVALVTIRLRFEAEGKGTPSYKAQADRSAHDLLQSLRPLVRKTDIVFLLDHQFHFLLLGATIQGGALVQNRLWEALLWRIHNMTEGELLRPRSVAIGHSAYPQPQQNVQHYITAASETQIEFTTYQKVTRKASSSVPLRASQQKERELSLLARKLGIPYLALLPRKLSPKVLQIISPQLAQELRCYPLGWARNTLTVALSDPQDHDLLERLEQATGLHIYPVLTHPQELQAALEVLH